MPRRWLARAGLVLIGLTVGIFAAEGVARLWQPPGAVEVLSHAGDLVPGGLFSADADAVWIPTPGFEGTIRAPGHAVPMRINDLGTRGAPLDPAASERWLLLGDSFALALQVTEEDSVAGRLQAAAGVEVLNAGTDGYSTFHAARRLDSLATTLADQGLRFDRVILLFFLGNDLSDNAMYQPHGRGIWTPGTVSQSEGGRGLWGALRQRSVLLGIVSWQQRITELSDPSTRERRRWVWELQPFTRAGSAQLKDTMRPTRRGLGELQRVAARHKVPLLVATAPPAFAVETHRLDATFSLMGLDPAEADVDAPAHAVAQILRGQNIAGCPLTPDLRAAADAGESPYLRFDGHWNPAGHAIVTRTLLDCVGSLQGGESPD
jgi:hypothetical protein